LNFRHCLPQLDKPTKTTSGSLFPQIAINFPQVKAQQSSTAGPPDWPFENPNSPDTTTTSRLEKAKVCSEGLAHSAMAEQKRVVQQRRDITSRKHPHHTSRTDPKADTLGGAGAHPLESKHCHGHGMDRVAAIEDAQVGNDAQFQHGNSHSPEYPQGHSRLHRLSFGSKRTHTCARRGAGMA
jgi:hypothetical protein